MQTISEQDDILSELDDFLSPDLAVIDTANELDSLDALLADSLRSVAQDKAAKESRKSLAKGNLNAAERAYAEAKVHEWEMARLWTPKASVLYFEVQLCNCGAMHSHFRGFYQRQAHRTSAISRWVENGKGQLEISGLPKEVKEDLIGVPVCSVCCGKLGWEVV